MYIEVNIPYDIDGFLAQAYNRALEHGVSEWVLFLDQDVFLCNPHWYKMCGEAIETLQQDSKAACVGCVCGGEHRQIHQNGKVPIPNGDIEYHIEKSKEYYHKYGNTLEHRNKHVTGFFLLMKRSIAKEIGFNQMGTTINNIDVDFGNRLLKAGYHIYTMPGLYVYHRRGMKHLKKEFKTLK